ncbi:hypothetical protein SRHO_G00305690 [Serrasalmus rhombeus]
MKYYQKLQKKAARPVKPSVEGLSKSQKSRERKKKQGASYQSKACRRRVLSAKTTVITPLEEVPRCINNQTG